VLIVSAQKRLGVLCSLSFVLTISTRMQFFCSTTPFCWGTRGAETANQYHAHGKTDQKRHSWTWPIVTENSFHVVGLLIIQPQSQAPKVFKHFILAFQKENLRVTRIVINDNKNIPLAIHRATTRGTDLKSFYFWALGWFHFLKIFIFHFEIFFRTILKSLPFKPWFEFEYSN
jgi:hypothetical protein